MKIIKRISFILVFILLLSMVPAVPSAAAPSTHPNTYTNTGDLRKDILGVAATQLGYKEGSGNDTKYGDWYGLPNNPWCAMFVSWCADQANIPETILKKSSKASPASGYFDLSYRSGSPKPGDLFFEKSFNHVGLVYKVEDGYFISIEGNSDGGGSNNGDGVVSNRRRISSVYFATPDYDKDRGVTLDFNLNGGAISNASLSYDRYEVLSSDGIKLRSGPGTSYSKLTALPKGAKFTVTEKKTAEGYIWGKTTYGGKTGWCVISESWTKKIGVVSAVPYKADGKGQLLDSSTGAKVTRRISTSAGAVALPTSSTFGIARAGYTFAGWSTAAVGGKLFEKGKTYSASQIDSKVSQKNVALSLYAVWMPAELSVSYNANGALIRSADYRIESNAIYKATAASAYLQKWAAGETKPNGPTNCSSFGLYKPGYTFKGWSTKASGGTIIAEDGALSAAALYLANENKAKVVLYAIWEANTLSVQYHANGGVVNSSTYQSKTNGIYKGSAIYQQKWTYNEAKSTGLVNDSSFGLSRSGYRFVGWGTAAQGGKVLHMDNTALLPSDMNPSIKDKSLAITLYAIWVPNSHNHQFATYRYNYDATSAKDGTETAVCSCGASDIRIKSGTKLKDSSAQFSDVAKGAWYCSGIDYALTYSLMGGNGAGKMLPQKGLTRAEFTQMLANLAGIDLPAVEESRFEDVAENIWYAEAVEWAAAEGIVSGTSTNKFSPDQLITREQICAMLGRYYQWKKGQALSSSAADRFADDGKVSPWAKAAVYGCKENGIVSGTSENEFSPLKTATRAEAATMMARFHAFLGK